jgi:hypothetical protein
MEINGLMEMTKNVKELLSAIIGHAGLGEEYYRLLCLESFLPVAWPEPTLDWLCTAAGRRCAEEPP